MLIISIRLVAFMSENVNCPHISKSCAEGLSRMPIKMRETTFSYYLEQSGPVEWYRRGVDCYSR